MPGNWPDPARPGYPLNPERDGWHWLQCEDAGVEAWFWASEVQEFLDPNGASGPLTRHPAWTYLGPCLTPAEVAAREAAAIEDEERNPWKAAVIDAMVCWEMLPAEGETPKEALNRLLVMEQTVALDPAVSSAAAKLVAVAYQRGQREMQEAAANTVRPESRNAEYEIRALPIKETPDE